MERSRLISRRAISMILGDERSCTLRSALAHSQRTPSRTINFIVAINPESTRNSADVVTAFRFVSSFRSWTESRDARAIQHRGGSPWRSRFADTYVRTMLQHRSVGPNATRPCAFHKDGTRPAPRNRVGNGSYSRSLESDPNSAPKKQENELASVSLYDTRADPIQAARVLDFPFSSTRVFCLVLRSRRVSAMYTYYTYMLIVSQG